MVLLHGHPRTSATWHRVAPLLVGRGFTVVCPDLRGYGRSTSPAPTADHSGHSKRAVAGDVVEVMRSLGHTRFALVGHDRGGCVALRPDVVRAMLEDYRAGLTIDRRHEEEDRAAGTGIQCPTQILWSLRDDLEDLYGDPLKIWRAWAPDVRGHGIDAGHHVAKEAPEALASSLAGFFGGRRDE
ncbi:Fluoroacetate dehalogenase [Streptomyces hundungensis]|uniref:Fluoroacetate dehalogenase n=1 Tax=Streptomyces hundungensis TaxID=1077946 RepID=A0A387H4U9_9ACTN|nr:Fluoroacetate dehalogenase [Streptomyces hundungensis]